jgi:hypothetical protein
MACSFTDAGSGEDVRAKDRRAVGGAVWCARSGVSEKDWEYRDVSMALVDSGTERLTADLNRLA